MTAVNPGQIWQARDGRQIRVIHLTGTHALCGPSVPKARGRGTRVRLDRLVTEFRLVTEGGEPSMDQHHTSVEPTPDGGFTAACTCGLSSPGWATQSDALAITAGHLEEIQES